MIAKLWRRTENLGVAGFLEKLSTLSGGHYGASMIHEFRGG
jgi:hypothetical protein